MWEAGLLASSRLWARGQVEKPLGTFRVLSLGDSPSCGVLFQDQHQSDVDAVFRSAIEDLCVAARRNGVRPLLVFIPTLDELQSTNQSRVLAAKLVASGKLGGPVADLTSELVAGRAHLDGTTVAAGLWPAVEPALPARRGLVPEPWDVKPRHALNLRARLRAARFRPPRQAGTPAATTRVVPSRGTLAGQTNGKTLYLEGDPVHLDAAGNALVAQRLLEQITKLPAL